MKLPDEKSIERIFIRYIDKNNIDIVSKHNIGYALENFLLDFENTVIVDGKTYDLCDDCYKELKKIDCLGIEGARIIKASRALCNLLIKEKIAEAIDSVEGLLSGMGMNAVKSVREISDKDMIASCFSGNRTDSSTMMELTVVSN